MARGRDVGNLPGMPMRDLDRNFTASIPELYDRFMVPLIFEPYAEDLAERVRRRAPASVLEIAAGTGVATRALARALPPATRIVATDLHQSMLDRAAAVGTAQTVEWREADAMQLPFDDASFDVVACQFGAMFFPDKPRAFAEARRVLKPDGAFIFSVWDRIEENEFFHESAQTLGAMFPHDPPRFMARTPHGYHDPDQIALDLAAAGFSSEPSIEVVEKRSRAPSPWEAAIAYCQANPLRHEIEANGPGSLVEATERCARALEKRFGPGPIDGRIQALLATITA
jgi:SAM-dependent methyltransferase